MLTREDNEIVTRVGPGTPMGNMIRQYWIPSAMSSELPSPDCPPRRWRLLGENLIGFRTTSGAIGVIADACPHRGASMFFGRNEEEGLRCVYHGWKFDVEGNCVDMPSEPAESNFRAKVKATAYPAQERGGLIWIYMGPREVPPSLPSLAANMREEGEYELGAYYSECNWLQSLEGDYDTIHSSFLHRGNEPFSMARKDVVESRYQVKTRWARHAVFDTEFGCSSGNNRPAEEGTTYWRVGQFLFPFYAMIPSSFPGLGFIAVVPIDDQNCLRFESSCTTKGSGPRNLGPGRQAVDGISTGYSRDPSNNTTDWLGRYHMAGNRRNDYLIDRELQKAGIPDGTGLAWSGIPGRGQDGSVTESMGVIYQRDHEHLGVTDSGIIRMRRLLVKAAKALRDNGTVPPAVDKPELYKVRSACAILPDGVDGIQATMDMQWRSLAEDPPQITVRA